MRAGKSRSALLALLTWGNSAHAGPEDVARLEYARSEQAASCPDRGALESAVSGRLGYDPFFRSARRTVSVEISEASDGLRAQLRLVDQNGMITGSRELHESAEHCDELVASLALAISIALDPSATIQPAPAGPESTESAAPEPVPVEVAPALPEPTKRRAVAQPSALPKPRPTPARIAPPREPWALRAGAFGTLSGGPALGFRVGASRRWEHFAITAEVGDQLSLSKSVDHIGDVRVSVLSAKVAPCVPFASFAACALFELSAARGSASGILEPKTERKLVGAFGARLEYSPVLFGQLRLLANADVLESLAPVAFQIHSTTIWESPTTALVAGLGLELRLR